jgi:hypothetical protein
MIYLLHIFICFCLIIFQTTIAPHFQLFGGLYDLLIPFIIYLGLFGSLRASLPFVLFLGVVQDNLTGSAYGLFIATYFWLYISMRLIIVFLRKDNKYLMPFIVVSGVLIENIIFVVSSMLGSGWRLPSAAVNNIIAQIIWALFSGPVFLLFYIFVYRKWEKLFSGQYSEES